MVRAPALLVLTIAPLLVPSSAAAECSCRLDGDRVPLGTQACMTIGGRRSLYRCAMSQNVTSWERVADHCPSADRGGSEPLRSAHAGQPPAGGLATLPSGAN